MCITVHNRAKGLQRFCNAFATLFKETPKGSFMQNRKTVHNSFNRKLLHITVVVKRLDDVDPVAGMSGLDSRQFMPS